MEKRRTEWDFELGGKLDGLVNLDYTTCGLIVSEALELNNKNGWKRLDQHLLARIAQSGRTVLPGLRLGDAHKGVFNGEY